MDVRRWLDIESDAYLEQPAPLDYFDDSVAIGLAELERVLKEKQALEATTKQETQ